MDGGLSEYDLYTLCTNNLVLKRNLAGVLPRNYQIRKKDIQINSYYIINNSSELYYGDHWLLIYYGQENVTFFDPFGYNEDFYNYSEIVEFKGKPLERNVRKVQSFGTEVCAFHCLFVAYHMSLGIKFNTIINNIYSENTVKNDDLVRKFVQILHENGSSAGGK